MISTSEAFQRAIAENSGVIVKADLEFADGTTRSLTGDDFMLGGVSLTQAVSSAGSFDIGAAIVGSCTLRLNNVDGRFDECDFADASVRPYIGKELPDGTVEYVRRSAYTVDQPDSYGATINLTGVDAMDRFKTPYSEVSTTYPATLGAIVRGVCSKCGVTLYSSEFPNDDYTVSRRPDDSSLTCLAVLSYAAQIAGCWCRIDNQDRLVVEWYDLESWEQEAWLDGGSFEGSATPYPDGDDADGGNFDSYGASTGTAADGGDFDARPFAVINAFSSMTLCTDDVVITGIKVTSSDDLSTDEGGTGNPGQTYLAGDEGYVLSVEGNPFVLYGQEDAVAEMLEAAIVGMRFRPFSCSCIGDPSIEAGDPVAVMDAKGNAHFSHITSYTYKTGGYASAACSAKSPRRNSAANFSATTKAIVDVRNSLKKEMTLRQQAIAMLQQELDNSSGLYSTEAKQPDGSTIYYFHDKPVLAESSIVWKFTAEAMGISTDGGESYPYGLDVSGDAILNRIYAIGLDADYITTGRIESQDGQNFIDLDTGETRLAATAKVGGKPIATADAVIESVDVEYASGTSSTTAPTSGWSTTAPAWQAGRYIWQRTKTVNQEGTASYSKPTCIQGAAGQDGQDGAKGDTGEGVSAIVEQYYLSTSSTTQSGGSWSTAQPVWQSGRYIWTRSAVTWTDGTTTYTSPVLAKAINGANESAKDAQDSVTALNNSLDQQEVFDRLTDNGAAQGIFLQNGQLYINGEYIEADTISTDRLISKSNENVRLVFDGTDLENTELSFLVEDSSILKIGRGGSGVMFGFTRADGTDANFLLATDTHLMLRGADTDSNMNAIEITPLSFMISAGHGCLRFLNNLITLTSDPLGVSGNGMNISPSSISFKLGSTNYQFRSDGLYRNGVKIA
ncbi:MAG: hypothetical protein U0M51_04130 [Eggerthellaceae bacterium]